MHYVCVYTLCIMSLETAFLKSYTSYHIRGQIFNERLNRRNVLLCSTSQTLFLSADNFPK